MENRTIYVINGPNLNLLGKRNPTIYGEKTLTEINQMISDYATKKYYKCVFLQSNHEGLIVDYIQDAADHACAVVINPGALTHYSYSIRDAIEYLEIPCIEVHLSDIKKRESFRRNSVISEVCSKTIMNKQYSGYIEAINEIDKILDRDF